MSETPLAGYRVLVTGASSGIGQGVAVAFGRAGASVAVNYRSDSDGAADAVRQIEAGGGTAVALQADVSDPEQVTGLFAATVEALGGLDVLVANAGLQKDAPALELSVEDWRTVLDVNLTGQFLCCQAAARQFLAQGEDGPARAVGSIICMSSVHDRIPWAGHANYSASKGGIDMLMRTLAQEWAPKRIRVNSISPGAIKTPINTDAWSTPEAEAELLQLIPYGRVGVVEDVAAAAVWLASDAADYVTGTTLYVDGGMTTYPEFSDGG
ncbi:SDR family oxidoreductase [Aquipuribacter sp. MA13-6]|uniref:SDR family oxidoreductase n=1 Tax=unclassified Aquipuribacter TaxID=2635084 RepID=UPI003EEA12AE